jgi:dTDP-glucose pyrophosphorylase
MQRTDGPASLDAAQARAADAGLKTMMPFRRPFLDYVLAALADAGCLDICLVIGPDHGVVREYYTGPGAPSRARVSFAVQERPLGTADAVLAAAAFAGSDPFLVLNGDNYYPPEVFRALARLDTQGLPAFRRSTLVRLGNIDPDRVRSYAAIEVDDTGMLVDVLEKPDGETLARYGDDFLVSMNCWRFDSSIFEACRRVPPSPRGELEIPGAVRHAVRQMGARFRAVEVEAGVLDLSRRSDVFDVERRLASIESVP